MHMRPAPAPVTHATSSGCCPQHRVVQAVCPMHPPAALPALHRSDCCQVRSQPVRQDVFLRTEVRPLTVQLRIVRVTGGDTVLSPTWRALSLAQPAPFTPNVLDKKADLRI